MESFETNAIELPQISNVGMTIPEGASIETRRMLARYKGMAKPLLGFKGATLEIAGVVFFGDYLRKQDGTLREILDSETGEVIPVLGVRCMFLTDKGLLTTTSPVVAKWVQDDLLPLFTLDGKMGDLMEPVKVQVGSVQTKSGNYTYGFTFLD